MHVLPVRCRAPQSESTGKVVTLMSNDAQKVQDVMLAIHTLWGAPALILVTLVLLYQQVGWATFVGLGVMLLYSPVSGETMRQAWAHVRRALCERMLQLSATGRCTVLPWR